MSSVSEPVLDGGDGDRREGSVVFAKGWDCVDCVTWQLRGTGVVDAVALWSRFTARGACVKRTGGKVG